MLNWNGLDWIIEFRLKPSTVASKVIQRFEVKAKSEKVDSKNEESKKKKKVR